MKICPNCAGQLPDPYDPIRTRNVCDCIMLQNSGILGAKWEEQDDEQSDADTMGGGLSEPEYIAKLQKEITHLHSEIARYRVAIDDYCERYESGVADSKDMRRLRDALNPNDEWSNIAAAARIARNEWCNKLHASIVEKTGTACPDLHDYVLSLAEEYYDLQPGFMPLTPEAVLDLEFPSDAETKQPSAFNL